MRTKKCSKCGEEKPEICFQANPRAKSGLRSECRECTSAYNKQYYRRVLKPKNKGGWARIGGGYGPGNNFS